MNEFTRILSRIEAGDPAAAEQLLPLVYQELRRLAAQRMSRENPGQTLQPTALVHEAYLRLVGGPEPQHWDTRGHFFAAAAEAMRRILIERARQKRSLRRGGAHKRQSLDQIDFAMPEPSSELFSVQEALDDFERLDQTKAMLVKLRYFLGMTIPEAAEVLGISVATADRYWAYARAWLHARIKRGNDGEEYGGFPEESTGFVR